MILYSSSGCPTAVPDSLVETYLRKGYRKKTPKRVVPTVSYTPPPSPLTQSSVSLSSEQSSLLTEGRLKVLNKANKTQLITLKGVGNAIAEKIILARPIMSMQQLMSVSSSARWEDIVNQIPE